METMSHIRPTEDLTIELSGTRLPRDAQTRLAFTIADEGGAAVTDFDVEHDKRMHLIVVRHDMEGFQHLHPEMDEEGAWSAPVSFPEGGPYGVFADFKRDGAPATLTSGVDVEGPYEPAPFPEVRAQAASATGYDAEIRVEGSRAGEPTLLEFIVSRAGRPVTVEPYLGAGGHLVALREGDLAYLHVHPTEHAHGEGHAGPIRFETVFPSAGRYALFLQFQHEGRVHTVRFAVEVSR